MVKLACFRAALCHRIGPKPLMVVPRGYTCQATRRLTPGFVSMNTTILTLVQLLQRADRS